MAQCERLLALQTVIDELQMKLTAVEEDLSCEGRKGSDCSSCRDSFDFGKGGGIKSRLLLSHALSGSSPLGTLEHLILDLPPLFALFPVGCLHCTLLRCRRFPMLRHAYGVTRNVHVLELMLRIPPSSLIGGQRSHSLASDIMLVACDVRTISNPELDHNAILIARSPMKAADPQLNTISGVAG
ncbi:hypothetical protein KC359_g15 [Hortaea werneckii]|nr:hypothetical protein KC359_g15 [Hortaea werneckii]